MSRFHNLLSGSGIDDGTLEKAPRNDIDPQDVKLTARGETGEPLGMGTASQENSSAQMAAGPAGALSR